MIKGCEEKSQENSQHVKKTKKKYDPIHFPTFQYLIFGGILLFGPKSSVSKWSWALAATALFTGDRHKFIIGESESFLTSLWQQHHYQNDRQLVFFFVICRWVYLSFHTKWVLITWHSATRNMKTYFNTYYHKVQH